MRIELEYNVSYCNDEFCMDEYDESYTYEVDIGLQDIIEYLFKEKYGITYKPLSWYLEDGAREFVKDIEDSWLRNEIDVYDMLQDLSLKDFLRDKYKEEVRQAAEKNYFWYLRDLHNLDDYFDLEVWCEVE